MLCYVPLVGNVHVSAPYLWLFACVSSCAHVPMFYHVPMLQPSITAHGVAAEDPTGSCSRDGDVVIYVLDINQLNLHTLPYSVLVAEAPTGSRSCDGDVVIYVFDINQLNLSTLSYSVLVSVSVFMAFQLYFIP